jgi:hypothetical protein
MDSVCEPNRVPRYAADVLLRPVLNVENTNAIYRVNVRCPNCRREVTLDGMGFHDVRIVVDGPGADYITGQRLCSNPECRAHLFVVLSRANTDLLACYPQERIDFDATSLPGPVLEALEEAITCHAQDCYVAAAMMVRKTLEEVCRDRGAEGNNLKARIAALSTKIVLPQALLEGLDALRLLGNDAAHVESRDYEQVGKEEVEIAIDVTKEILKATYQLESIVARLTQLQVQRS